MFLKNMLPLMWFAQFSLALKTKYLRREHLDQEPIFLLLRFNFSRSNLNHWMQHVKLFNKNQKNQKHLLLQLLLSNLQDN